MGHVSLVRGVRVIQVSSLISIENWTTETLEIKIGRSTVSSVTSMSKILKFNNRNVDDLNMNGYGGAMSESDSSIMAPTPSDVMLYTLNKNTNIKNKSEKEEKKEKEE